MTIKDFKYTKIYSVNLLYLIFINVNRQFEEINKSQYLKLAPTNESKEKIKKHKELWNKIRDLFRQITKKSDDYDEKSMKIQFNSDDDLPLNKTIESTTITLVAILSFLLPIVFLRRMFMEFIKKCYIRIELTFLKELMLIKQAHQKSVIFITIGIS